LPAKQDIECRVRKKLSRFGPAILLRFVWAAPHHSPHCNRPDQLAISEDIASGPPEHDDIRSLSSSEFHPGGFQQKKEPEHEQGLNTIYKEG
jgi:hypothetical protein